MTSSSWSSHVDNDEDEECLNTVEDLAEGIIKVRRNISKEYTILLVGETGVGKTTFLSLLANILEGHTPDGYVSYHHRDNEAGGGEQHSQTNCAKIYEFVSRNDMKVRILDTPGIADTRGLEKDAEHKASIAKAIKDHISMVNAVLIIANGTLPRLSAVTDYALSTLSSIFPLSLAENIGIVFTNVPDMFSSNFQQESLPQVLRNTDNQFWIDNPIATWKKYLEARSRTRMGRNIQAEWRNAIKGRHQNALGILVSLFDWLDSRDPQPTAEILLLYERTQQIEQQVSHFLSLAEQLITKETEIKRILEDLDGTKTSAERYQNYQRIVNEKIWVQSAAQEGNTICHWPRCFSNCPPQPPAEKKFPWAVVASWGLSILTANPIPFIAGMAAQAVSDSDEGTNRCPTCAHPCDSHAHGSVKWCEEDKPTVVIDEYTRQKYTEATTELGRQDALKASMKAAITQLRGMTTSCLGQVNTQMEEYAKLSLSGCFAGHVRKTIVRLELHLEVMQQKGDAESARVVEESLKGMKEMLEVLEKAGSRPESD